VVRGESKSSAKKYLYRFLARRRWICLVDRFQFDLLPEVAKIQSVESTPDLLEAAGVLLPRHRDEAFICSGEKSAIITLDKLRMDKVDATTVSAPPRVILKYCIGKGVKKLQVDYGSELSFVVPEDEFKNYLQMAYFAEILADEVILIVQDREGFAVSTEGDGEEVAVGFRSYESAEDFAVDDCTLEQNAVVVAFQGILSSDLGGLVVDAGGREQLKLSRGDLERCVDMALALEGSAPAWLKKILG